MTQSWVVSGVVPSQLCFTQPKPCPAGKESCQSRRKWQNTAEHPEQRSARAGPVKAKLNSFIEGESRCLLFSFLTVEKKASNSRENSFACGKECSINVHPARNVDCFRCELQFISVSVLCFQDNCLKHSGDKQTTWP